MGLNTGSIDAEKEKVLSMLPQELSVIVILVEAYCEINEGWFLVTLLLCFTSKI